ncbi:MAG: lytic murein transglycosylase, partial [Parvibaculum sp.]|nr:lytic murein transglycosylase [Parvibaculum sp.]
MARIGREESPWLMVAGAALTLSVVGAMSLIAGPAHGQTASGRGPLSWIGDITGSINQPAATSPRQTAPAPQAAPSRRMAQAAPAKEWSGEDGASGHPLMTADAIRNSAANFDRCVAGFWPEAARRGVSEASFRRFTADLSPDLRIMDLMDSQPEFTKAVWDYLDIL